MIGRFTAVGLVAGGSAWLLAATALTLSVAAAQETKQERWGDIREALFASRPIADGAGIVALEAPYRAEDAAVVPIAIRSALPPTAENFIKRLHLIVDNNPSPVAGVFNFSAPAPGADIATRIRVDEYTHVRAIAETSDGRLYMTSRFVKAAGGCSAPASKDQAVAAARLGKMKLVLPERIDYGRPLTAQVLISHPNNSGLQFDQITGFYVPAKFIQTIKITYDGAPVLAIDSDISLSEDPSIHFSFVPNGPGTLEVRAVDTDRREFVGSWQVSAAGSS